MGHELVPTAAWPEGDSASGNILLSLFFVCLQGFLKAYEKQAEPGL